MERFDMRSPSAFRMTAEVPAERVTAFLQKVYGWMFIGLAVTAVVAFMVASRLRCFDTSSPINCCFSV